MRGRSVSMLVSVFVAAGCATSRLAMPVRVDCQFLRMASVSSPTQRMEFRSWGYSLLPPQGNQWCIGGAGPRGTRFITHPLFGKVIETRPSQAELRHTFGIMAIADEVPKDAKVETAADLFTSVERLVLGGQPKSRFKVVETRFVPDSSLGAECVRFDTVVEERDNPGAPGVVLVLVNRDNFLCRHPGSRTPTLIWIGASERYVQGTLTGPLLIDTLRTEWEPSVRSLQFLPRP